MFKKLKYTILFALLFSPLFAEKTCELTSSHFLELMTQELPQILDKNLRSPGLFSKIDFLEDGGPSFINSVYLITLNDGKELIIKIGNPIWKCDKTLNEVAALKFIKSNTDIPVPKVLAYETDSESSSIGYEYIIMNRIKGKPFSSEFELIYKNKENYFKILDQLALHIGQLKCFKFSHIGNFVITDEENIAIKGIVDFANYKIESSCDKYSEYAQHALKFYLAEMIALTHKNSIDSEIYNKYISVLSDFIENTDFRCLDDSTLFVFSHQDFVMKNILVDNDKVSAILDWEWSGSALSENESMTGFDFLLTSEDKAYFSKALEKNGVYNFFAPPSYNRELFYRLIGNVYTLVAFREWKEGKLEHTAKFLTQKLEQRKIRNNPDFDVEEFIKSITQDLDNCLTEFKHSCSHHKG